MATLTIDPEIDGGDGGGRSLPAPFLAGAPDARPRPLVLAADDDPACLLLLERLLKGVGCDLLHGRDGWEALVLFRLHRPDLVVLDISMPGIDGLAVCQEIKSDPTSRLTPVILISSSAASEDYLGGIAAGADDFFPKPVNPERLAARVRALTDRKAFTDELEAAETVLYSLALAVESRDATTAGHCHRLSALASRLGQRLGLGEPEVRALRRAGMLHDIGKVSIPDSILLKAGPLTPAERQVMEQHPLIGERICQPLRTLRLVLPIIRHHHERIDGQGYPDGLRGGEIPQTARILQVVDIYDALTSNRPYRAAMAPATASAVMAAEVERRRLDPDAFDGLRRMLAEDEAEVYAAGSR
jgi:putative two-component system response regulator